MNDDSDLNWVISQATLLGSELVDDAAGLNSSSTDLLRFARSLCGTDAVLRVLLREVVRLSRLGGATWDEVGAALAITRQSAHARYSHLDRAGVSDAESK